MSTQIEPENLRKLLSNYTLFETYYQDHQVEEIQYQGITYNFLDLLQGFELLSKDEHFAIRWMYILQNPTTKKALAEAGLQNFDMQGFADSGIDKIAKRQSELAEMDAKNA